MLRHISQLLSYQVMNEKKKYKTIGFSIFFSFGLLGTCISVAGA